MASSQLSNLPESQGNSAPEAPELGRRERRRLEMRGRILEAARELIRNSQDPDKAAKGHMQNFKYWLQTHGGQKHAHLLDTKGDLRKEWLYRWMALTQRDKKRKLQEQSTRKVGHSKSVNKTSGWVSHKQFCDHHGETKAQTLIKLKIAHKNQAHLE